MKRRLRSNLGLVEPCQAKSTTKNTKKNSKIDCSGKIESTSKYFKKENNSPNVKNVQNQDSFESPYKNLVKDQKVVLNDTASEESDFKTPPAIKRPQKIQENKNNDKKKSKKVTNSKGKGNKSKAKQTTLVKMLEKQFSRSECNPEHIQMAIALSKSEQKEKNLGENFESDGFLSTQEKIVNIRATLEQFGFKSNKECSTLSSNVFQDTKRPKNSKFRYITPTLLVKSQEDREIEIAKKISAILAQNNLPSNQTNKENYSISSSYLENIVNPEKMCFSKSTLNNLSKDDFYVPILNLPHSTFKCGSLLKDWNTIAGRDKSPIRNEILIKDNEESNCDKNDFNKIESDFNEIESDFNKIENNEIQTLELPTNFKEDREMSPDLFSSDDEIPDKSNQVTKINENLEFNKKIHLNLQETSLENNTSNDLNPLEITLSPNGLKSNPKSTLNSPKKISGLSASMMSNFKSLDNLNTSDSESDFETFESNKGIKHFESFNVDADDLAFSISQKYNDELLDENQEHLKCIEGNSNQEIISRNENYFKLSQLNRIKSFEINDLRKDLNETGEIIRLEMNYLSQNSIETIEIFDSDSESYKGENSKDICNKPNLNNLSNGKEIKFKDYKTSNTLDFTLDEEINSSYLDLNQTNIKLENKSEEFNKNLVYKSIKNVKNDKNISDLTQNSHRKLHKETENESKSLLFNKSTLKNNSQFKKNENKRFEENLIQKSDQKLNKLDSIMDLSSTNFVQSNHRTLSSHQKSSKDDLISSKNESKLNQNISFKDISNDSLMNLNVTDYINRILNDNDNRSNGKSNNDDVILDLTEDSDQELNYNSKLDYNSKSDYNLKSDYDSKSNCNFDNNSKISNDSVKNSRDFDLNQSGMINKSFSFGPTSITNFEIENEFDEENFVRNQSNDDLNYDNKSNDDDILHSRQDSNRKINDFNKISQNSSFRKFLDNNDDDNHLNDDLNYDQKSNDGEIFDSTQDSDQKINNFYKISQHSFCNKSLNDVDDDNQSNDDDIFDLTHNFDRNIDDFNKINQNSLSNKSISDVDDDNQLNDNLSSDKKSKNDDILDLSEYSNRELNDSNKISQNTSFDKSLNYVNDDNQPNDDLNYDTKSNNDDIFNLTHDFDRSIGDFNKISQTSLSDTSLNDVNDDNQSNDTSNKNRKLNSNETYDFDGNIDDFKKISQNSFSDKSVNDVDDDDNQPNYNSNYIQTSNNDDVFDLTQDSDQELNDYNKINRNSLSDKFLNDIDDDKRPNDNLNLDKKSNDDEKFDLRQDSGQEIDDFYKMSQNSFFNKFLNDVDDDYQPNDNLNFDRSTIKQDSDQEINYFKETNQNPSFRKSLDNNDDDNQSNDNVIFDKSSSNGDIFDLKQDSNQKIKDFYKISPNSSSNKSLSDVDDENQQNDNSNNGRKSNNDDVCDLTQDSGQEIDDFYKMSQNSFFNKFLNDVNDDNQPNDNLNFDKSSNNDVLDLTQDSDQEINYFKKINQNPPLRKKFLDNNDDDNQSSDNLNHNKTSNNDGIFYSRYNSDEKNKNFNNTLFAKSLNDDDNYKKSNDDLYNYEKKSNDDYIFDLKQNSDQNVNYFDERSQNSIFINSWNDDDVNDGDKSKLNECDLLEYEEYFKINIKNKEKYKKHLNENKSLSSDDLNDFNDFNLQNNHQKTSSFDGFNNYDLNEMEFEFQSDYNNEDLMINDLISKPLKNQEENVQEIDLLEEIYTPKKFKKSLSSDQCKSIKKPTPKKFRKSVTFSSPRENNKKNLFTFNQNDPNQFDSLIKKHDSSESICISDEELNYSSNFSTPISHKIKQSNFLRKSPEIIENFNINLTPIKSTTEVLQNQTPKLTHKRITELINPTRSSSPIQNVPSTPNNTDVIIKTRNITPMPDYDRMNTPTITKELEKIGVKNLKRKRGVQILKHVYHSTHPEVESEGINEDMDDDNRKVKRRKSLICDDFNQVLSQDVENNDFNQVLSQDVENNDENNYALGSEVIEVNEMNGNVDIVGEIPESERLIFEKTTSKKIHSCALPLHIAWYNFLAANPQIKENILLYLPLQLEVLYDMLKEQGLKYHIQDLLTFLDKKCITIRTNQQQGGQRRRQKKKQVNLASER